MSKDEPTFIDDLSAVATAVERAHGDPELLDTLERLGAAEVVPAAERACEMLNLDTDVPAFVSSVAGFLASAGMRRIDATRNHPKA